MKMLLPSLLLASFAAHAAPQPIQAPAATEADHVLRDVQFASGEALPTVRLHVRTLGTLRRDQTGRAANAVLILHGTTGSGAGFLAPTYAGVLFGPGQSLDASRYFIILPDNVGHGGSSKPSDGLHARFPRYAYRDMVELQYRLLREKLGVDHLRLVMGTSMGGMHTWVWGETHPEFMDALMPLASLPVAIAGRNRILRRMALEAIRTDPEWKHGEYAVPPRGLRTALDILLLMTSAPVAWQAQYPTGEAADRFYAEWMEKRFATTDANDFIYAFDASRDYNPSPQLEQISAPLTAVNSADDLVNPPELGILERETRRVPRGKAVVLPATDKTRGHGTHSLPEVWKAHLAELLDRSEHR
ncbi:MAG TPA: alpha/beta fold hydrolase [Myxococcales bacterium]|nr:alpha/beta fold hydrolase [Myxococcales bacterium]